MKNSSTLSSIIQGPFVDPAKWATSVTIAPPQCSTENIVSPLTATVDFPFARVAVAPPEKDFGPSNDPRAPAAAAAEGKGEPDEYQLAASLPMVFPIPGEAPAMDRGYVYAEAIAGAPGAGQRVADHHRRIHSVARGVERGDLESVAVRIVAGRTRLLNRATALRKKLAKLPPHTEEIQEGPKRWTLSAAMQFAFLVLMALALLFTDGHACATTLQESGIAVFVAEPIRAWVMASVPFMLAAMAKAVLTLITHSTARKVTTFLYALVALGASLCWGILFARHFPGMNQSSGELLAGMLSAGAGAATLPGEAAQRFVFLQLIAGAFGAAVLLEIAQQIAKSQRSYLPVPNAAFQDLHQEVLSIEVRAEEELQMLGRVQGRLRAIAAEADVLCNQAVAWLGQLGSLGGLADPASKNQTKPKP